MSKRVSRRSRGRGGRLISIERAIADIEIEVEIEEGRATAWTGDESFTGGLEGRGVRVGGLSGRRGGRVVRGESWRRRGVPRILPALVLCVYVCVDVGWVGC